MSLRRASGAAAVAIGAIVVVLLIVTSGHAAATLPADLVVTDSTCEDGNVTALTLRVEYHGSDPTTVTPHVWSARQHIQHTWQPENISLKPGVQTVRIETESEWGEIRGDGAQVYLADGQRRVIENWRVQRCEGDRDE